MHRFDGNLNVRHPRMALIANDALGNFAMSSVVGQAMRAQYPEGFLTLYTGSRVTEMAQDCTWKHQIRTLYGPNPYDVVAGLPGQAYDLVVNLENSAFAKTVAGLIVKEDGSVVGPCVNKDGRGDLPWGDLPMQRLWADEKWLDEKVRERHPMLESGFIGEIFCRSFGFEGAIPGYNLPRKTEGVAASDVLIATAASLDSKLWPVGKWIELAHALQTRGLSVGLLGAKPSAQGQFWKGAAEEEEIIAKGAVNDHRGAFTLPEVAGALSLAKLVVTIDNGILHLACSTQTPTIGLFRHGIHRLWAPPVSNLTVVEPGPDRHVSEIEVSEILSNVDTALANN
jgi:ADP-heptose:LPS heptosyltransferase